MPPHPALLRKGRLGFTTNGRARFQPTMRRFHDDSLSNIALFFFDDLADSDMITPRNTIVIGRSAAARWNATPVTAIIFSTTLPPFAAGINVQVYGIGMRGRPELPSMTTKSMARYLLVSVIVDCGSKLIQASHREG